MGNIGVDLKPILRGEFLSLAEQDSFRAMRVLRIHFSEKEYHLDEVLEDAFKALLAKGKLVSAIQLRAAFPDERHILDKNFNEVFSKQV